MTRLFVVPTPIVPDVTSMNFHGSLKKRVAPAPPPGETSLGAGVGGGLAGCSGGGGGGIGGGGILSSPHYGTLPTASHSRTTSEPILTSYTSSTITTLPPPTPPHASLRFTNTASLNHKRSPSGDYSAATGLGPDELRKSIMSIEVSAQRDPIKRQLVLFFLFCLFVICV